MSHHDVYIEIAENGLTMAHVPAWPGCVLRAPDRAAALRRLPGAMADHAAWLRRHGEAAPPPGEPIEFRLAGETTGSGPFGSGDTAALLPTDLEPVAPDEMEAHFRLMGHARADLLALVCDLDDEFLDWQPAADSFSIRQVLRHVGNAEEWYVSRLVPPETLPAAWQDDEALALFEFLDMERRTAIARLRQIEDRERGAVFYPAVWTSHPEEGWTLRKALRRALEHEREHTGQVRDILDARRRELLAALDAARQALLAAAASIPPGERATRPVCGAWTWHDLAGHLADWEQFGAEGLRLMVQGQEPRVEVVEDIEAWNHDHVQARRGQPWDRVWSDLHTAHQALLAALDDMDAALVGRAFAFPWGGRGTPYDWAAIYVRHDQEHTLDLQNA